MSWVRVVVEAGAADPEALAEVFGEAGALSVTFEDAADEPILEPPPGATPLWSRTRVVGLFDEAVDTGAVRRRLEEVFGAETAERLVEEPLPDRDWVRAWMDGFEPMRFGERLWICPSHAEPPEPGAVNIFLDPGLAFGTGTHPTTALCLEWLDAHPPRGLSVIDYGCGSGILALAALKLGAAEVWGVDNDPQALTATADNAARNGLEGRVQTSLPEDFDAGPADLLLANILANPLIELAPRLAALVRPGGRIVLSGILADQAQAVADAYAPWFTMAPPAHREDWIRLEGSRSDLPKGHKRRLAP